MGRKRTIVVVTEKGVVVVAGGEVRIGPSIDGAPVDLGRGVQGAIANECCREGQQKGQYFRAYADKGCGHCILILRSNTCQFKVNKTSM